MAEHNLSAVKRTADASEEHAGRSKLLADAEADPKAPPLSAMRLGVYWCAENIAAGGEKATATRGATNRVAVPNALVQTRVPPEGGKRLRGL